MNEAPVFTVEHGRDVVYSRSCVWRVQFYDPATEQFYAGSSDTNPWEALAWALVERVQRIANGNHPTMSRDPKLTPVAALALVTFAEATDRDGDCRAPIGHIAIVVPSATTENGTIQHVGHLDAPEPAAILHPSRSGKTAAGRRARAKKG